jgi:Holliday junction DNA helicase RuvA
VIGVLKGTLRRKSPDQVVLEVGGVGYRLFIPLSTFYALGEPGEPLELEVHTHVREDAFQLFGFLTPQERILFERLITVGGIGPRLASTILSGMPPEDLVPAIRAGDTARLVSIPGVGRKTAERIVLELREKLQDLAEGDEPARVVVPPGDEPGIEESVSALVNLGYRAREARRAVEAVAREPGTPVEILLREALRRLSR